MSDTYDPLGSALTRPVRAPPPQPTGLSDNPQLMGALLSFGLQAMQPMAYGQTAGGHLGQAIGAAGESATRYSQLEQKRRQQESEMMDAEERLRLARSAEGRAERGEGRAESAERRAVSGEGRAVAREGREQTAQEAAQAREKERTGHEARRVAVEEARERRAATEPRGLAAILAQQAQDARAHDASLVAMAKNIANRVATGMERDPLFKGKNELQILQELKRQNPHTPREYRVPQGGTVPVPSIAPAPGQTYPVPSGDAVKLLRSMQNDSNAIAAFTEKFGPGSVERALVQGQ